MQYTFYFAARKIESLKSGSNVKREKILIDPEIREMLSKVAISTGENKEEQFLSLSLLVGKRMGEPSHDQLKRVEKRDSLLTPQNGRTSLNKYSTAS